MVNFLKKNKKEEEVRFLSAHRPRHERTSMPIFYRIEEVPLTPLSLAALLYRYSVRTNSGSSSNGAGTVTLAPPA